MKRIYRTYQNQINTESNLLLPVIIGVGITNEKLLHKGSFSEDPFVTCEAIPYQILAMGNTQNIKNSNVTFVTGKSPKERNQKAARNLGAELDKIRLKGKR
ncbi:MAG: hypothetical protein U9Q77_00755 [Candidatus Marinimicrobia bacterium]|nr:hypothetical protein [Candidatus Neomarinimicrobiota bacterium]